MVYVLGFLAALAVANSTLWASPISTQFLGGADLSLFAGLMVTGLLYYLVVKRQLPQAQTQNMSQSEQAITAAQTASGGE